MIEVVFLSAPPDPSWAGLGPEAGEDPRWWPIALVRGGFRRVPLPEPLARLEALAGPRWDGRARVVSGRGRLWVLPPVRFPLPPAAVPSTFLEGAWAREEEIARALHRLEESLLGGEGDLRGLTERAAEALAAMVVTPGAFLPTPLMEALGLADPPRPRRGLRLLLAEAEAQRMRLPAWWGDPETSTVHHLALAARAAGSALEVRLMLRTLLPDPPEPFRALLREFVARWEGEHLTQGGVKCCPAI